jgi:hypothetical protein
MRLVSWIQHVVASYRSWLSPVILHVRSIRRMEAAMRTVFAVAGVLGHPPLRFLTSRQTILSDLVEVMPANRVTRTGLTVRVTCGSRPCGWRLTTKVTTKW